MEALSDSHVQDREEQHEDVTELMDPELAEQVELSTVQDEDVSLALSRSQAADAHREHMENYLLNTLLAQKKHHLMTQEKYDALLQFLRNPDGAKCDPKFRHWATKRHDFALQVESGDGLTVEKIVVSVTIMDKFGKGSKRTVVTVIPTPALFDVTEDIHVNKLGHGGYKRVKLYAEDYYYGITRVYVQEFCRSCPVCQEGPRSRSLLKDHASMRRSLHPVVKRVLTCNNTMTESQRPVKFARRVIKQHLSPVVTPSDRCTRSTTNKTGDSGTGELEIMNASSLQFMASVQVDVIDMSDTPDGDHHCICHVLDFFSKYHVLFPMKDLTSEEIAMGLRDRVFAYFGPAKKIYIGDGYNVIKNALRVLLQLWPDTTIIQGKACDTVSSQKIAQAVEHELAAIRKELQIDDGTPFAWTDHLAKVMFTLNSRKPDPKLDTPYGVVLGHPPLSTTPLPGLGGRVIEEEQLEDLIEELLG